MSLTSDVIFDLIISNGYLSIGDVIILFQICKKDLNWDILCRYARALTIGKFRVKYWIEAMKSINLPSQTKLKSSYQLEGRLSLTKKLEYIPTEHNFSSLYDSCLMGVDIDEITKFSHGMEGEIMRDVLRTYQTCDLFREDQIGHRVLTKVLVAISKCDQNVGYCQGMNFVAGKIIMTYCTRFSDIVIPTSPDEIRELEIDCFEMMYHIVRSDGKLGMVGLWGDSIPKLKLKVYQLDRLLRWNYDRLHEHFGRIQMSPEVICAQWFMTLFAYSVSPQSLIQLWDYIFLMGWEGIFRISVSFLGEMEEQLLEVEDMEGIAILMKEWKKSEIFNYETKLLDLIDHKASKYVINQEVLSRLQESFASEVLSLAWLRCNEEFERMSQDPADFKFQINENKDDESQEFQDKNSSKITYLYAYWKAIRNQPIKIQLGRDSPTFWLTRYGYKLELEKAFDLFHVNIELQGMENQVEQDKIQIQSKIVKVSETHRDIQELSVKLQEDYRQEEQKFVELLTQYHACVTEAQFVSNYISKVIQTIDTEHESNGISEEYSRFPSVLKRGPIQRMFFWRHYNFTKESGESLKQIIEEKSPHNFLAKDIMQSVPASSVTITHKPESFSNESPPLSITNQLEDDENEVRRLDEALIKRSFNQMSLIDENTIKSQVKQELQNYFDAHETSELERNLEKEIILTDNDLISNIADDEEIGGAGNDLDETLPKEKPPSELPEITETPQPLLYSQSEKSPLSPTSKPHFFSSINRSLSLKRFSATQDQNSDVTSSQPTSLYERTLGSIHNKHLTSDSQQSFFSNISEYNPFSALKRTFSSDPNTPPSPEKNRHKIPDYLQLNALHAKSHKMQQKIISSHKVLEEQRAVVMKLKAKLNKVQLKDEELMNYKKSLCDQLQLLVEDSNRARSQKLIFVAENFIL